MREPSEGPPPSSPPQHTGSPTEFLKGVVGKRVIVRLISGVDYRGKQTNRLTTVPHVQVTDS